MSKIVIVDKNDRVVGSEDREVAPRKGLIFRLVRIFVVNRKRELYFQKRSPTKVVMPNRWDQSAGGHVDEGEDYLSAAKRELEEELGIKDVELTEITKFYNETPISGTIHKKFNMLYKVAYDGKIILNQEEIADGKWFSVKEIDKMIRENPDQFTHGALDSYEIISKQL